MLADVTPWAWRESGIITNAIVTAIKTAENQVHEFLILKENLINKLARRQYAGMPLWSKKKAGKPSCSTANITG
jgi:hypothetical protein